MRDQLATTGFGSRCKTTVRVCPKCKTGQMTRMETYYAKCDSCGHVASWKACEKRVVNY